MVEDQKKHAYHKHSQSIREQIFNKSEMKKQARLDYLEEGRKMRLAQADEILKLETIKKQKLLGLK
jgi:hypothetical protein